MREYFIDGIPYISKEQFCKLAHIRKANALKLIQSGLIPYIDIGNQTHRYLIRQSDAEAYLTDRAHDPAKYSFQRKSRIQTYPGKFDRNFANELSQYASVLRSSRLTAALRLRSQQTCGAAPFWRTSPWAVTASQR